MKKLVFVFALVLCLCGCSCGKKTEVTQMEIDLKKGQDGYEWACKADSTDMVKLVSSDKDNTYKFIFEGVSPGMTTITCKYTNTSDIAEVAYELYYQVQIDEKNVISEYSKTGTYIEDTIPTAKIFTTTK